MDVCDLDEEVLRGRVEELRVDFRKTNERGGAELGFDVETHTAQSRWHR